MFWWEGRKERQTGSVPGLAHQALPLVLSKLFIICQCYSLDGSRFDGHQDSCTRNMASSVLKVSDGGPLKGMV